MNKYIYKYINTKEKTLLMDKNFLLINYSLKSVSLRVIPCFWILHSSSIAKIRDQTIALDSFERTILQCF